jgi:hypothetical protein
MADGILGVLLLRKETTRSEDEFLTLALACAREGVKNNTLGQQQPLGSIQV